MTDNSISDDNGSEESSETKIYIPSQALATQDGTTPEMGDSVSFTCEGTVNSIDGDNVCVSPTTVNGEPVGSAPAKSDPTKDDLMAQAQSNDMNY